MARPCTGGGPPMRWVEAARKRSWPVESVAWPAQIAALGPCWVVVALQGGVAQRSRKLPAGRPGQIACGRIRPRPRGITGFCAWSWRFAPRIERSLPRRAAG